MGDEQSTAQDHHILIVDRSLTPSRKTTTGARRTAVSAAAAFGQIVSPDLRNTAGIPT
jgi:hypothetical protein